MHIKKIAKITTEYAIWGQNTVTFKEKRRRNVMVATIRLSSRLVIIYEQLSYVRACFGAVRHMVTFPHMPPISAISCTYRIKITNIYNNQLLETVDLPEKCLRMSPSGIL